jgi:tRNA(fMet)-specific endonuclease VapC
LLCVDSTFCIDLSRGLPSAVARARDLSERGEHVVIASPTLTEFLVRAFAQGGQRLSNALALVSQFEVLEITEAIAMDAARLGGECVRRGSTVGNMDLLIAAAARHRGANVLTRDPDFGRIPGVLVETY